MRSSRHLIDAYLAAVYVAHDATQTWRITIGERCTIDAPPMGQVHAIVTACNPASHPLTDAENEARMVALREQLDAMSIDWLPAGNAASDGRWREPSCWIPSIPLETADALALKFGQNACVIVEHDGVARLRIYRTDWRVDDALNEWLSWHGESPA